MLKKTSANKLDWTVFAITNLFNLIMVAIFLSRVKGLDHPQVVGWVWVAFSVLLAVAVFSNIKGKREKWEILLPLLFIAFLLLEIMMDYILKLDFRNTWLIGPYLLLYYLSIMGMIGYTFRMGKIYGFITLISYFLSQIAALYSYVNVGHG
jgi:hypothetical protein